MHQMRFMLESVLEDVQVVLCTATLPPAARRETLIAHGLNKAVLYAMPTIRRNLALSVLRLNIPESAATVAEQEKHVLEAAKHLIHKCATELKGKQGGRMLVFAPRKHLIDTMYLHVRKTLAQEKISIERYHADLAPSVRARVHRSWKARHHPVNTRVIVCTNAFGTGIDAPDVRVILHVGVCESLAQYAQEIGRAGRDERHAMCTLLYSHVYASSFASTLRWKAAQAPVSQALDAHLSVDEMDEFRCWAEDTRRCRNSTLYLAMNGQAPPICTLQCNGMAWCDVCRESSGASPARSRATESAYGASLQASHP